MYVDCNTTLPYLFWRLASAAQSWHWTRAWLTGKLTSFLRLPLQLHITMTIEFSLSTVRNTETTTIHLQLHVRMHHCSANPNSSQWVYCSAHNNIDTLSHLCIPDLHIPNQHSNSVCWLTEMRWTSGTVLQTDVCNHSWRLLKIGQESCHALSMHIWCSEEKDTSYTFGQNIHSYASSFYESFCTSGTMSEYDFNSEDTLCRKTMHYFSSIGLTIEN